MKNTKTSIITNLLKGILLMMLASISPCLQAQSYSVSSPDKNLEVKVNAAATISYEVSYKGKPVIITSAVSMTFSNGIQLGKNAKVTAASSRSIIGTLSPVLPKNKTISNDYNLLQIDFEQGYHLLVRAYNEGVAYRFQTDFSEKEVTVITEEANFNFAFDPSVIFPEADEQMWSWERAYDTYSALRNIKADRFAITPTLFTDPKTRIRTVIAEADLWDYPGMYVQPNTAQGVKGKWAQYPKKVSDPEKVYSYHRVTEREPFLAKTRGKRDYPWRVIIVTDKDTDLLNNELIYKLARPSEIRETSWIQPGKSTWEWWHDAILDTKTIPSGPDKLSFELYKYYIDFAAANHLEYLTMDAGWSMDYAKKVCDYAASKGVKVIVWDFINLAVENPARLDDFKKIGAVGVKVDLIERDDQVAMQWIEKFVKECAKRKLMVVLHGAPKPTGWQQTYPNIVNYEAVRGSECEKWDETPNTDYHLQFPFIRMLAGPLDYTPGSMRNTHRKDFQPVPHGVPMSMGTRVHEMAMYVVFDQPVAYLCDAPTEYEKYPETMKFLSEVPTTWDKTLPLEAEVGEYAVMARQKGNNWYLAAMTNHEARTITIDFSFLPDENEYEVAVYRDNEQTETDAKRYTYEVLQVNRHTKKRYELGTEGGLVMVLKRK